LTQIHEPDDTADWEQDNTNSPDGFRPIWLFEVAFRELVNVIPIADRKEQYDYEDYSQNYHRNNVFKTMGSFIFHSGFPLQTKWRMVPHPP
jgi:hypothetical protein